MAEKLCDKVLEKIKEEKIEPKPRWQFLLKDCFVWIAFAISVVIGAIAFCVILDAFTDNDWDVYKYAIENPLERIMISLPFIWIVVLILFLGLAYYNYKNTKSGYRHEAYVIFGLSIATGIIFGAVFHFGFGMGEKAEDFLAENLPFYNKINSHCSNREVWLQPEKGLLAGEILSVSAPDNFDLEDFSGMSWKIEKNEDVIIRGNSALYEKEEVKIIGEKEKDYIFHAIEIRPWRKGCSARKKEK